MTLKEIEKDMKEFTGGSSFIRIGQLASYLGQKNTNRVKEKYTKECFKLEGSPSYFIPDVAKNIYRAGIVLLLICSILFQSIPVQAKEDIDFEEQGFELMNCTAYCMGEITATGAKVHEGGCACNTRIGQVAIVYTMDGHFLGYYECNDTGGTEGKVYVKWIDGKG